MTSKQIRQQFLDFFTQQHAHTFVPSSPVVPLDDPTLLFANAGMNQFKPIFLAVEKRPYSRAVNTQKCIRAGGKHNDLDDVGKDTYHHTFFEMLGNWSFGDYFKKEAIAWAWDLLTNVWNLDKSRLHATVFMGDPAEGLDADREATDLWKSVTDINPDHVHLGNKKDNFWEMGDTGPCGPCSEIHYDRTPDKSGGRLVNAGHPSVIEIWNLVFIQFNRSPDGRLNPLPAKHVDTGMGFERVCAVIQGKDSNYDTDVFAPLLTAIADLAKTKYTTALNNPTDIAFRVIADHARMSTFAITDGATPSNKKRGAVLRSVIRRAVRFGYQILKLQEPFLHKLVPVIADQMGDAFPELRRNPNQVIQTIKTEETDFLATIERGLRIFDESATKAASTTKLISGADTFNLHATLGFPADLTVQLALERGLSVDLDEYNRLWAEHVAISGAGRKQHAQVAVDLTAFKPTDDAPKYHGLETHATILGYLTEHGANRTGRLNEDDQAALLLDRTTFYAEQGGQVGDIGAIQTPTGIFDVTATERKGDHVLHWGTVREGTLSPNQQAAIRVDPCRADTMRNHTTTHLLNWALKKVLGDHIEQKGSLVDPEKLRFDFSHPQALTPDQAATVERLVNEKIYADLPVTATVMPLDQAKKIPGVRAVFGEKYPDPVRVISIGADNPATAASPDMSIEFCGGTHLTRTGQAGFFKIVAEDAVAKGVRRLTAVTGRGAIEHIQKLDQTLRTISQSLSSPPEDAPKRIAALQDEIKQLKKKLASGPAGTQDPKAFADTLIKTDAHVLVAEYKSATQDQLLAAIDSIKKRRPTYAVLLAAVADDKVNFVAAVSDDLIAKGLKAGDWVREAAKVTGGGGGGRPQMAQAGGKEPAKLPDALDAAKRFATGTIK
jgi:alanyl-tRNA synthetase